MTAELFTRHRERLEGAVRANLERGAFIPFQASPSRKAHPEGARERGRDAFEARLGKPLRLGLPGQLEGDAGWVGSEVSPYTGEALGVRYERVDAGALLEGMQSAARVWAEVDPDARVGLCLEILERWHQQTFENALATMHTTGQAFMLAFAGSGASSLDRGLEALAAAHSAMQAIPRQAIYSRRFGAREVTLDKRYHLRPVGTAVVFSCGSYPAWNAYPAILANLATGNPVVLKPHPETILPMAIALETAREALREFGYPADILTMAADTWEQSIGLELLDHPDVSIVDFTGGQRFGAYLEAEYPRLQVYTETAGCNAVLLESVHDLDAALGAVAHGLVMFSGQMCTTPQNIYLPAVGVREGDALIPFDEVVARLIAAVDTLVESDAGPAVMGALHSTRTLEELEALGSHERVLRASAPRGSDTHPKARTASPLIIALDADDRGLAQREHFGPISFVLRASTRDEAARCAANDATEFGAIASYLYSVDEAFIEQVVERYVRAGASIGVNLVGQKPMQFTAGFSDFHVTGLNPAGNACLTDPAFVARRFRVVQSKVERG